MDAPDTQALAHKVSVFRDRQLTHELAWVLVIKAIALFVIWLAFFSHPVSVSISDSQVHKNLFAQQGTDITR